MGRCECLTSGLQEKRPRFGKTQVSMVRCHMASIKPRQWCWAQVRPASCLKADGCPPHTAGPQGCNPARLQTSLDPTPHITLTRCSVTFLHFLTLPGFLFSGFPPRDASSVWETAPSFPGCSSDVRAQASHALALQELGS